MNKSTISLYLLLLLFIPFVGYAEVNPADLIKLTPETNPSCVEYFNVLDSTQMYCSTKMLVPPSDPNIKQNEHQNIVFDERQWVAASGQRLPMMDIVEYVPAGVDIAKWNELVTSQFMPDPENKFSPKLYVDYYFQTLKKTGFSSIVQIIKDTPNEIIFEFRIESPANQMQDELQKVVKGPGGLYMLRYTIKKADMGQENRAKWLGILGKSSIK